MQKKIIACLGDSITKGRVSFNWIKRLQKILGADKYAIHNFGVDGDLTFNALLRLESLLKIKPDHVIILLGTNDVRATLSTVLSEDYIKQKKLPKTPNIDWFRINFEKIIGSIQQSLSSKIGVLSIPILGENLISKSNVEVNFYNSLIHELSKNKGFEYIPLNEKLTDYLRENLPQSPMDAVMDTELALKAVMKRYLLMRSWNRISRDFGLKLTTDTIHLNQTSGEILVNLLIDFINKN